MVLLALSAVFVILVTAILVYKKWLDTYWTRRGLYHHNSKGANDILSVYKAIKARGLKYGGYIHYLRPKFMTVDLDILKDILIKDADHFLNRGMYNNPRVDPLTNSLPRLKNEEWKIVRKLVSRLFSSGKMKFIFPSLAEHAEIMLEVIGEHAKSNEAIEAKDVAKRFGMDALGSCVFGFEVNTLRGNNKEFQNMINKTMDINWKKIAEIAINSNILKFFRLRMTDPVIEKYFRNLVSETRAYRQKHNVKRKDIFECLEEMTDRNLGTHELVKNQKLSSEQMLLQIMTFFFAGFETSSTAVAFSLLELSQHQDIQDKLRENIRMSLTKHGKLTYEAIMDIDYLDYVVKETLRKNTPSASVSRVCNKAYKIPRSNFSIQPGETVSVSIIGIHMDPDYYPEPEKFDPDRFTPENKAKRHPITFLPFGDGPRTCIGSRLGLLVTKVAVGAIISEFQVTLSEKTITPIKYDKKKIFLEVAGGVWLHFTKLDN